MKKHVALLRGINVGGKNKVPMPELKKLFLQNGFSGVSTYINSGNVIFESGSADTEADRKTCERFLAEAYPFRISVMVISADDLREALANAPDWWDADGDSKHNAIFVIPPAHAGTILDCVGETKPEYESVAHHGRVIFWSAPVKTFSRARLSRIVSTSAYGSVTIRNANTTKKLCELVGPELK